MNSSPVTVVSAISVAISSSLALLNFLSIDQELVGGLQAAAGAWVVVGGMLIHRRTTPTDQVALTKDEAKQLDADRGAGELYLVVLVLIGICAVVWLVRNL